MRGVGAQIQNHHYSSFTAKIEAFNSSGLSLGSFTRTGASTYWADNSASFMGVLSDQADIAKVSFNVWDSFSALGSRSFSINQMSLNSSEPSVTAVPTPALLPGLIGMSIAAIRKRKREAIKEPSEAWFS